MTKSLYIGEVIQTLLQSNTELKTLIGNKVYPIVAAEGTQFPFIVYKRTSLSSNGCKDGYYEDNVNFTITICSIKYSEGIKIAQLIRTLIERPHISVNDMELSGTHITNAAEEYTDNVYVQKINISTKIS